MYKIIWAFPILLFLSCNRNIELYQDEDMNFYPLEPEVYLLLNKERQGYYKVIHFNGSYDLSHSMYSSAFNTRIEEGYHLFDNQGYNGYDFERTFSSMDDAVEHADKSGGIYFFRLGKRYQFRDGALYKNNPFKKLEKVEQ